MRFRMILGLAALALTLGACGAISTASAPAAAAAIKVTDVWSRPALGLPTDTSMDTIDGPTAIVYLSIRNTVSAPDRLLKAESPVAHTVELHTSMDASGVMSMRPLDRIDIPAGGSIALRPGGFHIMLLGLTKDLKLGDTFDVTLHFEQAGTIQVQSTVRQPE